MKFLFLVLVLIVIGVKARYKYSITAKRVLQVFGSNPFAYMNFTITNPQNITYFVRMDHEHPFTIKELIINEDTNYEWSNDVTNNDKYARNACNKAVDGSWNYLAVKIVQMNLMPHGKCPVNPGSYDIDEIVGPIIMTLPKKVPCGDYTMFINVYRRESQGDVWGVDLTYRFKIKKDDNCISQDKK